MRETHTDDTCAEYEKQKLEQKHVNSTELGKYKDGEVSTRKDSGKYIFFCIWNQSVRPLCKHATACFEREDCYPKNRLA